MYKLLKIQLLDWFDLNKALHTKDKKEKRNLLLMLGVITFVLITFFFLAFLYTLTMANGYESMGLLSLFLPLLMLTASMVTLVTTLSKANSLLFRFKDYDLLMSLPIKTSHIIGSRILMLYIMSLFFNLILMIPGCIAYSLIASPSLGFYVLFVLCFFFIPLVPIILASLVSALISLIASRFKSVQLLSTLLSFLFVLGFMGFSMMIQDMGSEILDLSATLTASMNKLYPLALLYGSALGDLNIGAALLFISFSLLAFYLFSLFLGKNYKRLNTALMASSPRSTYKAQSLKTATPFKALYQKELKRYFSSSLYVLNTGFGVVFMVILSLLFAILGPTPLENLLQMPGLTPIMQNFAPFALAFCSVLSCTTACSISLEGKNLWIIKSSPIKAHTLFMSKLAVNLTVVLPCLFVSSALLAYTLQTTWLQTFLLFALPTAYTFWSALLGLMINLKFPSFNWASETMVIKQSVPAVLAPLAGFASIGVCLAPLLLSSTIDPIYLAMGALLFLSLLSILLYAYIRNKSEALLYKLQ